MTSFPGLQTGHAHNARLGLLPLPTVQPQPALPALLVMAPGDYRVRFNELSKEAVGACTSVVLHGAGSLCAKVHANSM